MILWRFDGREFLYDPTADAWRPMTGNGAPSPGVAEYDAAWTGSELILWGYGDPDRPQGALYDPIEDHWRPMSTVGEPVFGGDMVAVWDGSEMLVWGARIVDFA